MNWGLMLVTQVIIAVAVVVIMGWSVYAIVRALISQKSRNSRFKK